MLINLILKRLRAFIFLIVQLVDFKPYSTHVCVGKCHGNLPMKSLRHAVAMIYNIYPNH